MMPIINNTALYTGNILRVSLRCSHHTHIEKVTMWGDGYVNYLDYFHYVYMYIKTSWYTP